ncbi:hypothetical protein [Paenibacillus illinoisensis]|uniref:hypothetical protein n=1 Tax=Paenibacillus illinoisensis TaxID=59845 RepID=UPI0030169AE6
MRFELPISPYNDVFINCIESNLLGILIDYDSSFKNLPNFSYGIYVMNRLKHNIHITDGQLQALTQQGSLLLRVYQQPIDFDPYFSVENTFVTAESPIFEIIKNLLKNNYYVFIEVDRFFMPGGYEYSKEHKIHQTCVYGFDDNLNCFLVVEDCVKLGYFDYYSFKYEDFEKSLISLFENKGSISLTAYKLKNQKQFQSNTREALINKLYIMEGSDVPKAVLPKVKYCEFYAGFDNLKEFSNHFESAFHGLNDNYLNQYSVVSKPFQNQLVNINTVNMCYEEGILTYSQKNSLLNLYEESKKNWELYKNNLLKYILVRELTGKKKFEDNTVDLIRNALLENYEIEQQALHSFLSYLK